MFHYSEKDAEKKRREVALRRCHYYGFPKERRDDDGERREEKFWRITTVKRADDKILRPQLLEVGIPQNGRVNFDEDKDLERRKSKRKKRKYTTTSPSPLHHGSHHGRGGDGSCRQKTTLKWREWI
jgi:hypothetical protein